MKKEYLTPEILTVSYGQDVLMTSDKAVGDIYSNAWDGDGWMKG